RCAVMPRLIPSPAATDDNRRRVLSSTAPVFGLAVLQYSAVLDGILPLPSPPQPITLPLSSTASEWSRPQLIDTMRYRSGTRTLLVNRDTGAFIIVRIAATIIKIG